MTDKRWEAIIHASRPAFAGELAPSYGLATRTVALLRAQRQQQRELEHLSLRALWVSCSALVVVGLFSVGLFYYQSQVAEPMNSSILQVQALGQNVL